MQERAWPGNVRQLYNALVQAAVLTDGDKIGRRELVAALGEMPEMSDGTPSLVDRPLGDDFDLEKYLTSTQSLFTASHGGSSRGQGQGCEAVGHEELSNP